MLSDSVYNIFEVRSMNLHSFVNLFRLRGGGRWNNGASCGSRAAACDAVSANVDANYGCRGASDTSECKIESSVCSNSNGWLLILVERQNT